VTDINATIARNIEQTAGSLRRELVSVEHDIAQAQASMAAGRLPSYTMGGDVIGHRGTKVDMLSAQLATLINLAAASGLTQEEIQAAYLG
jgi:hypothetical protein